MGHGITDTDSTFSVRQMPWMGLLDGQVHLLEDYPTREEAQKIAHDWDPIEMPVYRQVPYIDEVTNEPAVRYEVIPTEKELVRSDTGAHLGVVASTRGTITNTEMYDVAEAVGKSDGEVMFETAGSLDGGKKVWVLLRMREPFTVKGDVNGATLSYFAIQGGYSRDSGAFRGQGLETRIVCANTSRAADLETGRTGCEFTFRHSSKVAERIEEAKNAVALWRANTTSWRNAMEHLIQVPVTAEQRELFVVRFQPLPPTQLITERVEANVNRARAELRSILDGPTCEGIDLTAYGLMQAGIEWSQHYRRVRGGDERVRMEAHFKRAMLPDDKLGSSIVALAQEVAHA